MLGSNLLSGATAQLVTTALAGGAHSLTASYAGDAHNNSSASNSVSLNMFDSAPPPTVLLQVLED
jgi:hypothetical protein